MSETPRPPGEPGPDPTAPYNPPSYTMPGDTAGTGQGQQPGSGYTMPTSGAGGYGTPAASDQGGYVPPPGSDGGYTPPPASGGGYTPPPTSGGGYAPPPSSGGGYPPPPAGGGYVPPPASGGGYPPAGGAYPGGGAYPPGGYGAPPPGYPAAGGYGGAPAGYGTADEKNMVMIAHWGGVAGAFVFAGLFGWVAPLIAYTSKGKESPAVRAHSMNALNFHLTWTGINLIAWIVSFCTLGIGTPLLGLTLLATLVIGVIGSVKATSGEFWPYPATMNLVK